MSETRCPNQKCLYPVAHSWQTGGACPECGAAYRPDTMCYVDGNIDEIKCRIRRHVLVAMICISQWIAAPAIVMAMLIFIYNYSMVHVVKTYMLWAIWVLQMAAAVAVARAAGARSVATIGASLAAGVMLAAIIRRTNSTDAGGAIETLAAGANVIMLCVLYEMIRLSSRLSAAIGHHRGYMAWLRMRWLLPILAMSGIVREFYLVPSSGGGMQAAMYGTSTMIVAVASAVYAYQTVSVLLWFYRLRRAAE